MACSGYRNTDYSMIWVFLAIIVICVLTVASPYVEKQFQSINNDLIGEEKIQELEVAFQEIQHPAGTERISSRNFIGEFTGGKQGCDFFVGEIRSFSGEQEGVLTAYSDQQIIGNPVQTVSLDNMQIPDSVSSALPATLNNLADWKLPGVAEQRQLYLVYVTVADYGESDCR